MSELEPRVDGQSGTSPAASAPPSVWCTVRVHGPRGAVDVALPSALTVAEIVERLRSRLLPGAPLGGPGESWFLHRMGEPALRPDSRLSDAALHDGDSVHLSRLEVPLPARPVDDGLVALAGAAGRTGRWTPRTMRVAAAVVVVAASTVGSVLALGLVPGSPAPSFVLAAVLLVLAVLLRGAPGRHGSTTTDDVPGLAAALGSIPAWLTAGIATADAVGGAASTRTTLAATAVTVGAALAAGCLPQRAPWWLFLGGVGVSVSVGAALTASGSTTVGQAGAILAAVWVLGLAASPWILTRSRALLEPDPRAGALPARARRARAVVGALTLAGAVVAGLGVLPLVAVGDGVGLWFAAAVAVALGLRARRSRFVVEGGAGLAAAFVVLTGILVVAFRDGGLGLRIGLLVVAVLVIAGLTALSRAVREVGTGRDEALVWWDRPRTRRTLGILETAAYVALLPLLGGVLQLYGLAADAGARL